MSVPAASDNSPADLPENSEAIELIPDVTGLSSYKAALAYAEEGLYLLPVATGKHPGSVVGNRWEEKSTRCPDVIEARWDCDYPPGIAIHTGRSGLVVFDLDIDVLPAELDWLRTGLIQSSRTGPSDRGHYVFVSTETFINGKLKLRDDTQVGEIKSGNSVILVEPSPHPKAETEGGCYRWLTTGVVPELPEIARNYLTTKADSGDFDTQTATDEQVVAFIESTKDANARPKALTALVANVAKQTAGTRDCVRNTLRIAADESRLGFYPYARAIAEVEKAARQSYSLRGERFHDHIGSAEFARLVANGVGVASARDINELRAEANRDYGDKAQRSADLVAGYPGAQTVETESNETPPTWAAVDMATALDGTEEVATTILARTDGVNLFYRGKVHSVHGESESGKTWLALCAVAECLTGGEPVLYVDFEDDAKGVGGRLLLMGVPRAIVTDPRLFAYARPETGWSTDAERKAFEHLISERYSLAVLDGVTESMGLFGLIGKDNDNVATWQRTLPNAISRATGAAVVCIDHVTKDADSRGRFAIGGQQKMAGLSGAAFIIEPETPFGRGLAGEASVRVGKDRPGYLRGLGGPWRKSDRTQLVAKFRLDSTDDGLTRWQLDPPDGSGTTGHHNADPSQRKWCMEQVSRYWEAQNPDAVADPKSKTLAGCSMTKTQDAMLAANPGTGIGRDAWRAAISALVTERYARQIGGPRGSHLHVVLRPYREDADETPDSPNVGFRTAAESDSGDADTQKDR